MTTDEAAIAARIQKYITVDESGLDADLLEIVGENGQPRQSLFTRPLYDLIDAGRVTVPDGTVVGRETLQLAFQNALIEKTGMCVLEHDYHRSGYPEMAALVRSARGV